MIQKLSDNFANFIKSLEEYFDDQKVVLKIKKSVQLDRYSCGIHSALMILKYFEKADQISEIDFDLAALKKDGIDTEPLLNILKSFNCRVKVNDNAYLSDIVRTINNKKPMLISVDDGEHWVVVYGYSKNSIYVLDPSFLSAKTCRWKIETFLERWDENWIAVISD